MARILVVEDDEDLKEVIGYNLKRRGHEVSFASDGEEALVKLKTPPDLMLLDIMLPRLDGFEVCSRMSREPGTSAIPVIFFTARGSSEDFERARHMHNFAGYFTKPYATMDVLRHIDKVLKAAS
ncbi:MAG TPA: response regulator [Candidatus Xenobia bacterium]|jgi:two-component system alkaline phosphatase synthesis response regulator PhoP